MEALSAQRSATPERLEGAADRRGGSIDLASLQQSNPSPRTNSLLNLQEGFICRNCRPWYPHLTFNHQSGVYDYYRCNGQQLRVRLKERMRRARTIKQISSLSISLFEIFTDEAACQITEINRIKFMLSLDEELEGEGGGAVVEWDPVLKLRL